MANGNPFLSDPSKSKSKKNPFLASTIEPTENILQRAMKSQAMRVARGIPEGFADVITLGATAKARELGTALGQKLLPSDEATQQEVQEQLATDPVAKGVGGATALGAGATGVVKGGIDLLFGRGLAKAALPKAASKLSEEMQKVIKASKANPDKLSVDSASVLKKLESLTEGVQVKFGQQAAIFRRWINNLRDNPRKLTADIIAEMEQDFGSAAKFARDQAKPALQNAAKQARKFVSDIFDDFANKAGVRGFKRASAKKGKLKARVSKPPGFIETAARRGAGIAAGGAVAGLGFGLGKKLLGQDDE